MNEGTSGERFARLLGEREAAGRGRYGQDTRPVGELVVEILLEAIDAANYAALEQHRLGLQYPDAVAERAAVTSLLLVCAMAACRAAALDRQITGVETDLRSLARLRLHGPAAREYSYDNYLYRDNFGELVEELADAYLMCETVMAALAPGSVRAIAYGRLAVAFHDLAEAALELGDQIIASHPPERRRSAG